MMKKLIFLAGLCLLVLSACSGAVVQTELPTLEPSPAATATLLPTPAATPAPGQHPQTYLLTYLINPETSQTIQVKFLLYLPAGYYLGADKKWPLLLFLHGSGEAGADLALLKRTGLPEILEDREDFPFIVVSPQIPAPPPYQGATVNEDIEGYLNNWGWKPRLKMLDLLVDELTITLNVDSDRVYLTGLSLGGFGTWTYILAEPERFAAAIPIAGGYHATDFELPKNLCDLKGLPIWAFHGQKDRIVDYRSSKALVDGLKACGAEEVRFTLVPEGEHDVWSDAYADPALWEWLLAQTK